MGLSMNGYSSSSSSHSQSHIEEVEDESVDASIVLDEMVGNINTKS